MKKTKKLVILCLIFALVFTAIPVNYTNAASKKTEAYKAYKKALEKKFTIGFGETAYQSKATEFTLVDVTGDGLKDLVINTQKGKKLCYAIFTYNAKEGVVCIYDDLVLNDAYYLNKSKHSLCVVSKWEGKVTYSLSDYKKKYSYFDANPKNIKSVPKGYTKLVTNYKNTSANRKKVFG